MVKYYPRDTFGARVRFGANERLISGFVIDVYILFAFFARLICHAWHQYCNTQLNILRSD